MSLNTPAKGVFSLAVLDSLILLALGACFVRHSL